MLSIVISLLIFVLSSLGLLLKYFKFLVHRRQEMQAKQEAYFKEGRNCIDRGLKTEEASPSKDAVAFIIEARKLYLYMQ